MKIVLADTPEAEEKAVQAHKAQVATEPTEADLLREFFDRLVCMDGSPLFATETEREEGIRYSLEQIREQEKNKKRGLFL